MGDAKVELGDGVTISHGSELMVKQEDLEGAMNSMKQHADRGFVCDAILLV